MSGAWGSGRGLALRGALDALQSPRARWSAPAVGAIVATALASWWQAVWPPTYTATARIVVEPGAVSASGAAGEWIATQADILHSDRVARRAAADLGLALAAPARSALDGEVSGGSLLERLTVEPSPRGGVIAVRFAGADPALAAQVADAFVAAYDRVSQEMQAAAVAAIKEQAMARLSALRDNVQQAQIRAGAADRTVAREGPVLAKAVELARLASPPEWSGLPGEQKAEARAGSLLADAEQTTLSGASLTRAASAGPAQDAQFDLEQARQALLAAQARFAQFDGDRIFSRPAMSILNHARESVSAPSLGGQGLVALAALCGLAAGWALGLMARRMDRRVVDASDLARRAGLAVLGVLRNVDARSPRPVCQRTRRVIAAPGAAVPALP